MKRSLLLLTSVAIVALALLPVTAAQKWIHLRVEDRAGDDDISVNVPLEMVVTMLPLIEADEFDRGRVRLDDDDWAATDLRGILEAVHDAPDGDFVTVRSRGESVRVAKEGGRLIVHADDDGERVRVRMPLAVLEALLSGEPDELDLAAAIEALGAHTGEDLVLIEDGETTVRIWIDLSETGR